MQLIFFISAEYPYNLSTTYTIMDFRPMGKGLAIEKVSTQNAFKVNMGTHFTGNLTLNGNTLF